eukprot:NODE_655_length_5500_cov_0.608776.p4 type:complete len:167 gc:universal NODE_655_length_5500_cov_0.608776:4779-5279(+)
MYTFDERYRLLEMAVQLNTTFELQDMMEIAQIQKMTISRMEHAGSELSISKKLLDCSSLFNEYAMKYELYDIQILLYGITKFNNLDIIKQSWSGLINNNAMIVVVDVIKQVFPSFNCPIQWIVEELIKKYNQDSILMVLKDVIDKKEMIQIWQQLKRDEKVFNKYY